MLKTIMSEKQIRFYQETIGLYSHKNATIEKLTEELIRGMDEKFLGEFEKDFLLDKDGIDTYGGKSLKGATHYAKSYINKSIKDEIALPLAHIQEIRSYMVEGVELTPESYTVIFHGVEIATRETIEKNTENFSAFKDACEAQMKEMALQRRGVETMGSFLAEEVQPQLEYTH